MKHLKNILYIAIIILSILLNIDRFYLANINAQVRLVKVVGDLSSPVLIKSAKDGTKRLFIIEKDGVIKILSKGKIKTKNFLDISKLTSKASEQGLLGLAFHPRYKKNRKFYVNYTDRAGATRVVEYQTQRNNPDVADPRQKKLIIKIAQPYENHNGGTIEFGPDKYLYIGTGDGGAAGDPENRASNLKSLLGKMLRVDVNTKKSYLIPKSNPFIKNTEARPEIYAYGLRNPWKFSFDRLSGKLFLGDVGQSSFEEIDIIHSGGNYGWRTMEGFSCYEAESCDQSKYIYPIADYGRDEGTSVTGGYVYRGNKIPELKGNYIFGDFAMGRIWKLTEQTNGSWQKELLLRTNLFISSFGEDVDGELLLVDFQGAVYRFERNA